MATISVAFVLIIAAVNGGFFARGFTRYEKGLLRACGDRAGEMDLDDRESATEGLRAMEDNYSVQFNLYENGKLIYATLGQSIYNRPGLTGFDVLTHADDPTVVLDSDTDRYGGVFAEVQVRSGTEYIVYTRAYGERTVKVMIRNSIIETSAVFSMRFVLTVMLASLFLMLAVSVWMSMRFTRPITQMNEIAQRMARLDFSCKTQVDSDDEIGELADEVEGLLGVLLVDQLDAVAGVHEHPAADLRLGDQVERHRAGDAQDVDLSQGARLDALDLGGDCQAHSYTSIKRARATTACP